MSQPQTRKISIVAEPLFFISKKRICMNRKTMAIIVIIIISVSQTSCTFLVRVFIRNSTDRPLELKFYRETEMLYQPELYCDYKDDLIKINQETLKQLDKRSLLI
jgi:hypothetical protein